MLVLTGPSGTGKSALAMALAATLNAEIVSADSALIYRHMDIGTAKPTAAERARVPHHLIDIRDPDQCFSVAEYGPLAEAAAVAAAGRGRLPLLVGGTGLYVRQVLEAPELPPVAPQLAWRADLERLAAEGGAARLHAALVRVDPVAGAAIHPANVRRVIRALEVHHVTGRPISSFWTAARVHRLPALIMVCDRPPAVLAARVAARARAMLAAGLVDEVQGLLASGVSAAAQAMQALGYKETVAWLAAGREPVTALEDALIRATLHYVKRQRTWWRAAADASWIDLGDRPAEDAVGRIVDAWRAFQASPSL